MTDPVATQLVPPSNTSLPTVSGTPQLGQTLTANEGSWAGTPPLTYAYQWRRCDSAGAACADVPGANAKTYVLVDADVNSTLRVVVTASNGSSVYASAVSNDMPRSYWRFGQSSGALIDEQGISNGVAVGSPQLGATGLLTGDPNAAVSFNGTNQYVRRAGSPTWTPSTFSFEILVRPSQLPVNGRSGPCKALSRAGGSILDPPASSA